MGEEINQVLLEFICKYEHTAEVCRAAIEEDGWQLEHVPDVLKECHESGMMDIYEVATVIRAEVMNNTPSIGSYV